MHVSHTVKLNEDAVWNAAAVLTALSSNGEDKKNSPKPIVILTSDISALLLHLLTWHVKSMPTALESSRPVQFHKKNVSSVFTTATALE